MHIDEYGQGTKTIILIHGGPSLFGYMKSLGNLLSNKYKIIDYAQMGTFESPVSGEKISIDTHIDDLATLITKYSKNSSVILIGHSWGADLALLTIARTQGTVEKAILIGTAALNEKISNLHGANLQFRYSDKVKLELAEIEKRLKDAQTIDEKNNIMQARLALTSPFYHLDQQTEKSVPESKWNFHTFLESIDSIWDVIDSGNIQSLLKQIKDPVIAFHGDYDPIPANETFEFLKENVVGVKTIKVENSGHFPWLEKTSKDNFLIQLKKELES